jgi:hypothetical protein
LNRTGTGTNGSNPAQEDAKRKGVNYPKRRIDSLSLERGMLQTDGGACSQKIKYRYHSIYLDPLPF